MSTVKVLDLGQGHLGCPAGEGGPDPELLECSQACRPGTARPTLVRWLTERISGPLPTEAEVGSVWGGAPKSVS